MKQTLDHDLPHVLDYLETQLPAEGFLFGEVSIADLSIACFFRNAAFARYSVDGRAGRGRPASSIATLRLPASRV